MTFEEFNTIMDKYINTYCAIRNREITPTHDKNDYLSKAHKSYGRVYVNLWYGKIEEKNFLQLYCDNAQSQRNCVFEWCFTVDCFVNIISNDWPEEVIVEIMELFLAGDYLSHKYGLR